MIEEEAPEAADVPISPLAADVPISPLAADVTISPEVENSKVGGKKSKKNKKPVSEVKLKYCFFHCWYTFFCEYIFC